MFVKNLNYKRRKSVKSKGLIKRPEVKQFNFLNGLGNWSSKHLSIWYTDPVDNDAIHPYDAVGLTFPAQGTSVNQRVGNKINLKWLRIKGYYNIYDTLISVCHLKFFLIRSYNGLETFNFTDLYNNWEAVNVLNNNVWDILTAMRHDYYKAVLNTNKVGTKYGLAISKLFELTMHPSAHAANGVKHWHHEIVQGGTYGGADADMITNPVTPEEAMMGFKLESVGNFPIDIKVRINETVDVTTAKFYVFYMVDYPYATKTYVDTTTLYPTPEKVEGFDVNFFCRAYFTDA